MIQCRNRVIAPILAALLSLSAGYANAKTHSVFSLAQGDLVHFGYYEITTGKGQGQFQPGIANADELNTAKRYRFNVCIRFVPMFKANIDSMLENIEPELPSIQSEEITF